MRRKFITFFMVIVFLLIVSAKVDALPLANDLNLYYMNNFVADTGALNSVAGIYLNYRVFDTLFETLLLLISVIGIIYFSSHKGEF